MCLDPVSLAVIGIGGAVLQGVGGMQAKLNNAATLDANAAGLDRDIAATKETTAYDVARTRETVQRTLGMQRAGMASNGIALSGSAAEVIADTATEGDLDIAAIRWNSEVKIDSTKYQQAGLRANAAAERAAAPLAFITPIISGATQFGGAFG